MIDGLKLLESIEMLYLAKWNIPTAANHCGLSNKEMKRIFSEKVKVGKLPLLEWGAPNPIQLSFRL